MSWPEVIFGCACIIGMVVILVGDDLITAWRRKQEGYTKYKPKPKLQEPQGFKHKTKATTKKG